MNERLMHMGNRARPYLVALGASLFAAGATWSVASDNQLSPVQTVAASAEAERSGHNSYAHVVEKVAPAVVTIRTEGKATASPTNWPQDDFFRRFFDDRFEFGPRERVPRTFRQRGLGSGVIVTADGYILTNHHVVDGADRIFVDLADGRTEEAKLVGSDEPSDLAVLKIDENNLPTLALGDSDAVQVGDIVLAVGNPLGIGQTVTMGIVSAKGRSTGAGDGSYQDFLQTDAPINQGNSGGALVNTDGQLVGINTQIISPSQGNVGIGFAIPTNMARDVMNALRNDGHVRRSQLGITVQPVTSDLAASLGLKEVRGAIVSSVAPDSAAERAGVQRGDVITSFDGQAVADFNTLRNRVAATTPGAEAKLVVIRDGSEKTLIVKLDEAESSRAARRGTSDGDDEAALGVSVAPLTPEVAARAGLPRDTQGLVVQDVNPDGRAAGAGIREGDVIVEANSKIVETPEELRMAVRSTTDRPLLLLINREGRNLFVTVRPS